MNEDTNVITIDNASRTVSCTCGWRVSPTNPLHVLTDSASDHKWYAHGRVGTVEFTKAQMNEESV